MGQSKTGAIVQKGNAFYLVVSRVGGGRKWIALKTDDRQIAVARARMITGAMTAVEDEDLWLRHLVFLGEWARSQLDKGNSLAVPMAEIWMLWRGQQKEEKAIYRLYETYMRRLVEWCESRKIVFAGDVGADVAVEYRDALLATGKATPGRELAFFKSVWKELKLGAAWDDLKASKTGDDRYRRLTIEEVRAVVRHVLPIRRDVGLLVMLGYYTGARLKTLRLLRVEDVDGDFLRVLHTKTAKAKPIRCLVPLVEEARNVVKELVAGRLEGFLFETLAHDEKPDIMRTMFKDAGVLDNALGTASFHSLRATFISQMDEAGISPHVTDAITGHAPQGMHGRYSQPGKEVLMEAVGRAIGHLKSLHGKNSQLQ